MPFSKTEICNLALLHLGVGQTVQDVDTERSEQAASLRRAWDISVEFLLRDFPWSFATRVRLLNLVEEAPDDEYGYSYRVPSDCLLPRHIQSGVRNDSRQSRVTLRIVSDEQGLLLLTDQFNPVLEYTVKPDGTTFWPSDFCYALSYHLASTIAPALTAGDANKLGERAWRLYTGYSSRAKSADLNQQQRDEPVDAEWTRGRL